MLKDKLSIYVEKFRRNKHIWLFAIIFAFLCFGLYLFPHYATDTYRIIRLQDISIKQVWNDFTLMYIENGRYTLGVMMLLVRLVGLNPLPTGLISNLLSIALIAVNIVYVYSIVKPYLVDKVKTNSFIAITAIFLSPCFADWFQFAECTPYYLLGVLLCIIGVKMVLNKYKVAGFSLLFVAIGVYQPILSFFVFFYMLIAMLQLIDAVQSDESKITKMYFEKVAVGVTIYALLSGIQLIIIKSLGISTRVNLNVMDNISTVIKSQPGLWRMETIGASSYMYIILFFIAIVICIVEITILSKKNRNYIICGIFALISLLGVYASIFVSHIFAEAWLSQRTVVMFYALFSFVVLINLKLIGENFKPYKTSVFFILSLIISMIFIYRTNDVAIGLIKTNTQDAQIAMLIDEKIKEYEGNSGFKVENIAFVEDQNITWQYPGVFCSYDLNVRAWAIKWSRNNLFYQYTGRDLNEVDVSSEVYNLRYEGKDWSNYSEDQIWFVENTLYVGIY